MTWNDEDLRLEIEEEVEGLLQVEAEQVLEPVIVTSSFFEPDLSCAICSRPFRACTRVNEKYCSPECAYEGRKKNGKHYVMEARASRYPHGSRALAVVREKYLITRVPGFWWDASTGALRSVDEVRPNPERKL